MNRRQDIRAPALALFVCFAAPATAQTDLAPLFASPNASDIASVRADWGARSTTPGDWEVVDEDVSGGRRIQLVRYTLDGNDLYAMLRYPRHESAPSWPVMLWHHGGTQGLGSDDVLDFDADHPNGCLADSFIVAAPTYRGEAFRGGAGLTVRTSGGEGSPFDRDADDALALLDPRLSRTAAYFGPTDFRHATVLAECRQAADTGVPSSDPLGKRVMSFIVEPWLAGTKSLADARHQLTAWSVLPFLDAPLPVLIHHGEEDDMVSVEHGQTAAATLDAAGAPLPTGLYLVRARDADVPASRFLLVR